MFSNLLCSNCIWGQLPKNNTSFNMGLGDGGSVQVHPTSSLLGPLNVTSVVGVWGISLVFIVKVM
jgi:hypothetical protein